MKNMNTVILESSAYYHASASVILINDDLPSSEQYDQSGNKISEKEPN
jgi:hypothetical protein